MFHNSLHDFNQSELAQKDHKQEEFVKNDLKETHDNQKEKQQKAKKTVKKNKINHYKHLKNDLKDTWVWEYYKERRGVGEFYLFVPRVPLFQKPPMVKKTLTANINRTEQKDILR